VSSVENFDGPGLSDQPSIIYGFDDTAPTEGLPENTRNLLEYTETHAGVDDDLEIRELSRSGYGEPGPSPGDVIARDSTKSTLDDGLPELGLPGDKPAGDSCGNPFPAFACLEHDNDDDGGCGNQIYVGDTCYSPTCERCWPAAVKSKVVTAGGHLKAFASILDSRHQENIDFNHVVASLPSIVFDSDKPLKRALKVIKTLLEEHWSIEGFLPIYHPYRIKQEYRKDQYSHGGAEGEGDMTWKDVLSSDNPYQYLKFDPHFHLFFPAKRKQFSYGVVPGVYADSGWVFHRITKGGEDCNVSVGSKKDDEEYCKTNYKDSVPDLVHQLTYCFSHAGVNDWKANRSQLTSRMMGDLKTDVEYVKQEDKEEALAAFCDAAPRLLGQSFANVNEATCNASVASEDEATDTAEAECCNTTDDTDDHPLHDVWNPEPGATVTPSSEGDPWPSGTLDSVASSDGGQGVSTGATSTALTAGSTVSNDDGEDGDEGGDEDGDEGGDENDAGSDETGTDDDLCGGTMRPIYEAKDQLDDEEWVEQAEYADGLRDAFNEWQRKVGDPEYTPWGDTRDSDDSDGDGSLESPEVVLETD